MKVSLHSITSRSGPSVIYLPGQLFARKNFLKPSSRPQHLLFYVKGWIEKCQDVTNEHKYQCLEHSFFHGYSINLLAIPFLHLILIKVTELIHLIYSFISQTFFLFSLYICFQLCSERLLLLGAGIEKCLSHY